MATIQIRRKTSSGTGPLTGSSGTIKQGEPLVDLNGGNFFIAKKDKTASSSNQLTADDYFEYLSKANVISYVEGQIDALNLGSASKYDVGSTGGCIPIIDSDGKLAPSIIPQVAITDTYVVSSQSAMLALSNAEKGDIAVRTDLNKSFILVNTPASALSNWQELLTPTDKVTSVNGKTGAVVINCSDIGAVTTANFNSHVQSDLHLNEEQKQTLTNVYNCDIKNESGVVYKSTKDAYESAVLVGGLVTYVSLNTSYNPTIKETFIGIDKSKVLTPSSTIDGGTY